MSAGAVAWRHVLSQCGTPLYERAELGRVVVIVWTGESYLDPVGGIEVCSAYVQVEDHQYPDGLLLIGRRHLETRERAIAKIQAVDAALTAVAMHGDPSLIA